MLNSKNNNNSKIIKIIKIKLIRVVILFLGRLVPWALACCWLRMINNKAKYGIHNSNNKSNSKIIKISKKIVQKLNQQSNKVNKAIITKVSHLYKTYNNWMKW